MHHIRTVPLVVLKDVSYPCPVTIHIENFYIVIKGVEFLRDRFVKFPGRPICDILASMNNLIVALSCSLIVDCFVSLYILLFSILIILCVFKHFEYIVIDISIAEAYTRI